MCVCVWKREREGGEEKKRERTGGVIERERKREMFLYLSVCVCVWERESDRKRVCMNVWDLKSRLQYIFLCVREVLKSSINRKHDPIIFFCPWKKNSFWSLSMITLKTNANLSKEIEIWRKLTIDRKSGTRKKDKNKKPNYII